MDSTVVKQRFLRNTLVRVLLFGVLIIVVRFAYVVTLAGESCNRGDFCFFTLPDNLNFVIPGSSTTGANMAVRTGATVPNRADLYTSKDWIKAVHFYSSVFQHLIAEGHLSPGSKSLCVETPRGEDVYALREIGVQDAVGIYKKSSKPLVISAETNLVPFDDNAFDFIFSGGDRLDKASRPLNLLASEITRTLKPEGFLVVHVRAKDGYSLNSLLDLFNSYKLIRSRDFDGYDASLLAIREIVLQKESRGSLHNEYDVNLGNGCSTPGHKFELVQHSEPLIMEEPLKPWITLKKNIQNVKYLPSMADISFKNRYVYVDVGARSYGSSIGSWFMKQYPKQNKTFDVYAIEADKTFHKEYREKKKVTLLPYAAWVKNETLSFEINGDPGKEVKAKGRGMGRIQPVKSDKLSLSSGGYDSAVEKIQGFDFAEWLKSTVTEKDFVVMKMDVEGTEFDLIPRLFQTGAICLVDELFLECHYNRWQRCCPGQRSSKYEKTYGQCLELFTSLRKSGVLVHQWW